MNCSIVVSRVVSSKCVLTVQFWRHVASTARRRERRRRRGVSFGPLASPYGNGHTREGSQLRVRSLSGPRTLGRPTNRCCTTDMLYKARRRASARSRMICFGAQLLQSHASAPTPPHRLLAWTGSVARVVVSMKLMTRHSAPRPSPLWSHGAAALSSR